MVGVAVAVAVAVGVVVGVAVAVGVPMKKPLRPRHPAFVVSLIGKGGASKTRTALRTVGPVTVISVDANTEFVAREEFGPDLAGCTIHQIPLPALAFIAKEDAQDAASDTWASIVETLRPLVMDADPDAPRGTVVFDTAGEIYQIGMIAAFGKLDQIHPEQRKNMLGQVNTRYRHMVLALKHAGYVVVLLHWENAMWVDAVERGTGGVKDVRKRLEGPFDYERQGYRDTDKLVTVEAVVAFDPAREWAKAKEKPTPLSYKFGMKYVRNTHRPSLTNEEYWGTRKLEDGTRIARNSIVSIGLDSFPTTTIDDWLAR